jgi:hypothetical protein
VHLYGIDTAYFYSKKEQKLHRKLNSMYLKVHFIKNGRKMNDMSEMDRLIVKTINGFIKIYKSKLINKLENNKKTRRLNDSMLRDGDIISVFDSELTRTFGCNICEVTTDIMIVQTYYFQVMESIVKNGFKWKGEKYVMYTASAGQIRLKKFVVVKESMLKNYGDTLTCGLTNDRINEIGGVNTNKYLAYLALQNSATERWDEFDIDKSIVVDDFETDVPGLVDYINYETYEIKENVNMGVPIPHMDGAGIYLPKVSKKNMMVRLPWVKGLLVSTPFDKFIKEYETEYPSCGKVKDIYGKEYDILQDDIQVIFTKSQFKMHKFYDSWDDYKSNFKKYNCHAGFCNEEVDDPKFARINYQMLQTLTDISDPELKVVASKTISNIEKIGSDKSVMMKILGADKRNTKKNYFQKSLELYPEMLTDVYSRQVLKDVKASLVKDAKSGKLFVDSHYAFICPDVLSFMEWLFLKQEVPLGALSDGEVSCKLYKKSKELAVLRSPHLYREWAIRDNVFNDRTKRWFTTNALYVSSHDLISKLLMFDVDGDAALVVNEKTLIDVGKRNMDGIVPLHYEMKKAVVEALTADTLYRGLRNAYANTTIGLYSNSITKVWNDDNPNLDVVKMLCLESNFSIDSAKTLFFIERPDHIDNLISRYTKCKIPHFFMHAKDKPKERVQEINDNTIMGRLENMIPNKALRFTKMHFGRFDYAKLMKNKGVMLKSEITDEYDRLNRWVGHMSKKRKDGVSTTDHMGKVYQDVREKLLSMYVNQDYIVDILVAHVYGGNKEKKLTLWSSFGDILFHNLENNMRYCRLNNKITCDKCGKRIEKVNNRTKYCEICALKIESERTKFRVMRHRM